MIVGMHTTTFAIGTIVAIVAIAIWRDVVVAVDGFVWRGTAMSKDPHLVATSCTSSARLFVVVVATATFPALAWHLSSSQIGTNMGEGELWKIAGQEAQNLEP